MAAVVGAGVFVASGAAEWLVVSGSVLLAVIAGLTAPLDWITLGIAALIPLQFYIAIPGTNFTLRLVVVLIGAAAMRVLAERGLPRFGGWLLPASVFLASAFAAGVAAPDRYLAFRGLYDWFVIFAVAWIVIAASMIPGARNGVVAVLIAAGLGEAILGLGEYVVGLNRVVELLQLPVSGVVIQPNLLKEKLADLSFNWITADRAVPFGTFINGIDYAVFLAAILSLLLALLLTRRDRAGFWLLLACAVPIGGALLLTYKGSAWIALAGGAIAILLVSYPRRRFSTRETLKSAALLLVGAIVLALPFLNPFVERLVFFVQREQGAFGTAGRLEIWSDLLKSFIQRPLFGYGLNNGVLLAEPMRTLRAGLVAFNATPPESAYVAALVETGIVGFVALMGLVLTALVRAWRNINHSGEPSVEIGLAAALVALLFGNITVAGLSGDQNGMLFGVLLGLIFGKWNDS
jgi:O-antigen ligase